MGGQGDGGKDSVAARSRERAGCGFDGATDRSSGRPCGRGHGEYQAIRDQNGEGAFRAAGHSAGGTDGEVAAGYELRGASEQGRLEDADFIKSRLDTFLLF